MLIKERDELMMLIKERDELKMRMKERDELAIGCLLTGMVACMCIQRHGSLFMQWNGSMHMYAMRWQHVYVFNDMAMCTCLQHARISNDTAQLPSLVQ